MRNKTYVNAHTPISYGESLHNDYKVTKYADIEAVFIE